MNTTRIPTSSPSLCGQPQDVVETLHCNAPRVRLQGEPGTFARTAKGYTGQVTPTEHEKREWSRMAQAAYAADRNDIGHRFSGAAALRVGEAMLVAAFDALQTEYRAWLTFGEMGGAA